MNVKAILRTAAVALVAYAIANRVPQVRQIIQG